VIVMEGEFIVSVGLISLFAVLVIMFFISRFLLICHPNQVIILSGRSRKLKDGSLVGYRIIRGGRALRMPLIERAAKMSLETIPIDLTVINAYSRGGIPLKVDGIANIKIDSTEPTFGNAVERFLAKSMEEIHEIAKDTLEGNLRGVVASLTPEEINEDRLKFAGTLIDEADNDLKQLGLQLDTLKIQNVSDESGYLDSIGRRKTAEILSEARKAEAIKQAEAEATEADSSRAAEVAKAASERDIKTAQIDKVRTIEVNQAKAQIEVEVEQNTLRIKKAELEKAAIIREKEAEVAGEKARVLFEQEVEEQRIILQNKRLNADIIEPALANLREMELEAKGDAAFILESGNAKVEILNKMIAAYKSADGDGERVFMLNMLPEIIEELTETVGKVTIDKVSVIDNGGGGGQGNGVGRFINQLPGAVLTLAETVENATGINILKQLQDSLGSTKEQVAATSPTETLGSVATESVDEAADDNQEPPDLPSFQ
jgi:flotillin